MKSIFTLVGPAKVGKTTLTLKVTDMIPDRVGIIKSATTRPKRNEEDALCYALLTKEEFEEKRSRGEFSECVEHAGNFYAYERRLIEDVLEKRHGICAATEEGVIELHRAGYRVVPIKILAVGHEEIQRAFYDAHPERKKADEERREILIPIERNIVNSFIKPDGLEKAAQEIINLIVRRA
ncbi:hypothetical protein HY250_04130 [Candidatus Azambacteria bacterium]|nr:hypothetical protein [Candidatus Azambacteria bacterium]MBI3685565.1 hypothetical protein [Candidatus Azambacteria bacterium]